MHKVLSAEKICGLFAVNIDGFISNISVGDIITDDKGRQFKLDSIGTSRVFNEKSSELLVLTPLNGQYIIGKNINA